MRNKPKPAYRTIYESRRKFVWFYYRITDLSRNVNINCQKKFLKIRWVAAGRAGALKKI
jgi:hypothetical protein